MRKLFILRGAMASGKSTFIMKNNLEDMKRVDDNGKNSGKKRNAILNKDYKYIGISYRFIGKTFISYFTFSK